MRASRTEIAPRIPCRRDSGVDDRTAHAPASGAASFHPMGQVERPRRGPAWSRRRTAAAGRRWSADRARIETRQGQFRGDVRNDVFASRGDHPQTVFGPIPAQARAVSLQRRDRCNRRKARLLTANWKEGYMRVMVLILALLAAFRATA